MPQDGTARGGIAEKSEAPLGIDTPGSHPPKSRSISVSDAECSKEMLVFSAVDLRIAVPGFGLSRPTRATSRLPSPLACRVVAAAHSNLERPGSANAVHRGSVLPVSQSEADSHVLGRNRRWRGFLSSFSAGRHVRIKGLSMGLTVTGNPVQWRRRDPSRHVPCSCWPWSSAPSIVGTLGRYRWVRCFFPSPTNSGVGRWVECA